jgi:AraC-like DNA-binding protein
MNQSSTQRVVGPLADIPNLLREMSVEPEAFLAAAGFSRTELAPGGAVAFGKVSRLLEFCANESGNPHFGMLLGSRQDHRSLGILGELMECAPSIGEAVGDYVSFQAINSTGASSYVNQYADTYAWGYGIYDYQSSSARQVYEMVAAIACGIVRSISRGTVQPLEILLQVSRPDDLTTYQNIFKMPVRFDQQVTSFVFSKAGWRHPLPNADPEKRARIMKTLEGRRRSISLPQRVRHAMRSHFALGDASLARVSETLGIHPRTLERQLKSSGTNFEAERDRVRYSVARELLEITDLQISDIAAALAYRSHTSFTHAFRRWSGTSPAQWRKMNRRA